MHVNSTAIFFHMFFKSMAIIFYMLGEKLFGLDYVLVVVACVILLACDFWTVKNISGRLLVGLRWWNEVLEDGTNEWKFESKPESRYVHPYDSTVFWMSLYVTPLVWLVLGIVLLASLSVKWMIVVAVALTLNGANCIGYWKCQKDAKARLQRFIARQL